MCRSTLFGRLKLLYFIPINNYFRKALSEWLLIQYTARLLETEFIWPVFPVGILKSNVFLQKSELWRGNNSFLLPKKSFQRHLSSISPASLLILLKFYFKIKSFYMLTRSTSWDYKPPQRRIKKNVQYYY